MKALRLFGIRQLKPVEEPDPRPGPGQIVLNVTHTALCRTDAKMWAQGQRDLVLPRILGHEIGVKDPESGRSFVVWPGIACGECGPCRSGRQNLCRDMEVLGFHLDGGLAERMAVSPSSLIPLPSDLSPEIGVFAEPLGCGINALERLGLSQGENALIFGGGPVGLLLAAAVQWYGGCPFVVDPAPDRLQRAQGFLKALEIESGTRAPDRLFQAAVNAAPDGAILFEGLERLAPAGRFCVFSGLTKGPDFPSSWINEIHYRELTLVGAYGCTLEQMQTALSLLSEIPEAATDLIDRRIGLEDVPGILAEVWESRVMKCVVDFESR